MISFMNKKEIRLRRLKLDTASFGSHFLLTASTNLILSVMALASGILVARSLGPKGQGELAAIQTWPTYISLWEL